MRRKARSLAQSQGLYTIQNPQRDYYRQQYNTITQDYIKYTQPVHDEEQPQEEKKERISDILTASGWGVDLALHPEQFAKDDAYLNEYHRLVSFLPENLAKTSVARTKAKAEAKKALPLSATDSEIQQLADLIFDEDLSDTKKAIQNKTNLDKTNVFRQLSEDIREFENWRMLTDPIKRAEELEKLHFIVQEQEKELKKHSDKLPNKSYWTLFSRPDLGPDPAAIQLAQQQQAFDTFDAGGYVEHNYYRDAISAFLTGRKEVRIQNYQGKLVRGQEFKNMAKGVQRIIDINDQLDQIDSQLQQYLTAYNNGTITQQQLQQQSDLLNTKRQLEREREQLSSLEDVLASYESLSPKQAHILQDKSGKRFGINALRSPRDFAQYVQSKLDDIGIGTDIGVHHMLSGYTTLLDQLRELEKSDYKNDDATRNKVKSLRAQIKGLLSNYQNFISNKQNGWRESAKEETEDLAYLKKVLHVSDYFQANQQLAQRRMDFSDPNTMLIAMPQQLGSSNASLLLSLGSMAVKIAAAASGNPYALLGGILAGSQLDIANAAWENNAETAQGYDRKFRKALIESGEYQDVLDELRRKIKNSKDMSDEDVLRLLYNGQVETNNIKANSALAEATFGSNSIYQYDMGETARGAYKESILQLAPIGPLAKATKYVLANTTYQGAQAIKRIIGTIGKGEVAVINQAENTIGETAATASKFAKMKANMVAFATSVPQKLLTTETVAGNLAGFVARTSLNAVSEGVEEGVQHVRQSEYVNGQYGPSENMGLFKPIVSDMILGGRLGAEWLTGKDAGSGYITDSQMFSEMRGGALGALFQSTPVHVISTAKRTSSEISAIDLIADMFTGEKMSQRDRIEKIKKYIKDRKATSYADLMKKLDRFAKINKDKTNAARTLGTNDVGVSEELIDGVRRIYTEAAKFLNNKPFVNHYKNNGIPENSDEFAQDAAIVIDQVVRLKESTDNLEKNNIQIDSYQQSEDQLQEELNRLTQRYYNAISNQDSQIEDVSEESLDQERPDQRKLARLLAALEIIDQYAELERIAESENKPVRKSTIKKQAEIVAKIVNKQLGTNFKTAKDLTDTYDYIDSDLKDLYRQNVVLQAERDAAKATVSRLLSPLTAIPTVKKLARQYNEAIKDDEDLQQRIHNDYVAYMEREQQKNEYQITEDNNKYIDARGRKSIVVKEGGQFVKYLYDDEYDEPIGEPMPFDKQEYYDYREIADANENKIEVPPMSEEIDVPVESEAEDAIRPYMDNVYDDSDEVRDIPSKEQADILIDQFLERFKNPYDNWNVVGRIKEKAKSITKTNLRKGKDKFGRSSAQRLTYLYNHGYRARIVNGKSYAVKGGAKVKINDTEARFMQFLEEKYIEGKVERQEISVPEFTEQLQQEPTVQSQPEPLYKPNALQEDIKNVLKKKAGTDKATLVGRNGNNYFFRAENGKVVMYTRLHAEIGSQTEDSNLSKDKREEVYNKMKELWQDKTELKKYIESLQNLWNKNLANKVGQSSDTYDEYKVDLSLYTTPDMLNDQHIIPAIAELMKGLRDDSVSYIGGAWAKAGNIVDEMLRQIISGRKLDYSDMIMLGEKPVLISDVMSEDVFESFLKQANDLNEWFAKNKLVPVTDRILLHATLRNGHKVAGETDLIAIDENGNLVIFDFKTSKYDFDESYDRTYNNSKWSTKRQHSRQLTGYQNLVQEEFEHRYQIKRRIIIPFIIQYNSTDNVFDSFISIQRQEMKELQLDEELDKELNTPADINAIKQEFEDLSDKIEVWGQNIADQFEYFSSAAQSLTNELKTLLDEVKEQVSQLSTTSLPLDIETTSSSIYNLQQKFEQASLKIDQEIQNLKDGLEDGNQDEFDKFVEENDPLAAAFPKGIPDERDEQLQHLTSSAPMPDDDEYWDHLAEQDPGDKKGRRRGQRPNERSLDEIMQDMVEHNQREGRLIGPLPGEESGGINTGPAAPIESAVESKSISEAPDYGNQPPVEFEAKMKERVGKGFEPYNVADRRTVPEKMQKEAGKPDFLQKVRAIVIPESVEKGLNGLFLSVKLAINGVTASPKFDWATKPRTIEDEDGMLHTVDMAERVKNKIRQLMKDYPGATIIAKLGRTNGEFQWGEKFKNVTDSILMTDDSQLLTLLDDRRIGISDETSIQPISRSSSSAAIYPFTSGIQTTPGIVTFMYDAYYDQNGAVHQVPIPLTHKRLADDDIDLIIDILKSARSNDLKQSFRTIKVGRRNVKSPLSDYDILNLLIRFGRESRETNNGNNFIFDFVRNDHGQQDKTRIEISGIGTDRNTLYQVDLDNATDVQKLKDRLKVSGFVYANHKNMLMHSLDVDVDNVNNPFGSISRFFKADENKKVKSITISSSLVFDRKDVDFNEDESYTALNGVGWAVRHGWILTQFEGLSNPRISVEDVDIDDTEKHIIDEESNKLEPKPDENTTTPTPVGFEEPTVSDEAARNQAEIEQLNGMYGWNNVDNVPFKIQTSPAKNKINTELAIKRIKRMLGKHFPVQIMPSAIKVFEQGKAWAVGACKKDAILLSTLAEAGTEYHETFHKVMELLLPVRLRNRLHKHYIKRYNNGVEMSEKETGERLADMFMDFINGLPTVTFSNGILEGFRLIGQWVRAWRSIDDLTLAMMYAYTYSGLARFSSVSEESSKNFDRIFGGIAYHTVNIDGVDVNFKEFVNNVHLRDGIKFVAFNLLQGYNIDSLGSNLSDLDTRMQTIKNAKWYKALVGEGVENKTMLQRMMSEIFDHWGSTQKLVNEELERLSIGGKVDRTNDKDENLQSPDPSVIFTDIDGHIDEFFRYDRKLDLDISLKIFLSTIPNLRYSTRDDLMWVTNENGEFVDKDGNVTEDHSKFVRRTRKLSDGTIVPVGTVDALRIKIQDKSGNVTYRRTTVPVSTNSLGVPEFMDFDTVYSLLVTRLQSAQNVEEMINRLVALGKDDPMFRTIAANFYMWNRQSILRHESGKEIAMIGDMQLNEDDYDYVKDEYGVYHVVYSRDTGEGKKGHVIKNATIATNVDKEALVTRMFQSFRSQRLKFVFVFANEEVDNSGNKTGRMSYRNSLTNNSHDARIYPRQWFENLRSGLTDIFEVVGSSIKVKKGSEKTFGKIATQLQELVNNMSSQQTNIFSITHNGKKITLSKRNASDVDLIESYFVSLLNTVGIEIDKPVLDYYLNETYGHIENKADRLIEMFSSRSKQSSFNKFIKLLNTMQSLVDNNKYESILTDTKESKYIKPTPATGMYLYADNAFIKEMGTAYGRYRLATNEFMTLGPENTKMYTMAQNHSASEFTDDFNLSVIDNDGRITGSKMLPDMMKFVYNYMYTKAGKHIGSIIIKHYLNKNRSNLQLQTFIGAKRDDVHDGGTKYTKIAKREDYLSKATILENGGLLFPTLSDKSTWFYLTGIVLPGLQYENDQVFGEKPRFGRGGRIVFTTTDDVGNYASNPVLDQFLEYAECERAAVVKAINELKTLKEDEKSEKNPGRKLELQHLIKNYHTNNQAARFAFLLGIYTEDAKDKNYQYKGSKEKFISFNFTKKYNRETRQYEDADLEDCLKTADKYFFKKSEAERRSLIANILQHRLDEELNWCVENGIIEKVDNPSNIPYGQYKNKLLNYEKIDILKDSYAGTKNAKGTRFDRIVSNGALESWAVVAYLLDINNKSIMSTEEVMRLYTGIPNFFKWKYGHDGILTDLHGDMVKRLGGLGSTGESNRLDLANIEKEYTVAEIKDWEVKSEIYEAYKEGFIDNEYRLMVFQQELEKSRGELDKLSADERTERRRALWKDIQDRPLEDVMKIADSRTRRIVEANAAAETKSFAKGINVADGTAFISPQMTLNLLRERGAYTANVQKAFEYLMGLDTGSEQLSNHEAYKTIFDALISTQKYSAFGYRMQGDVPVHYYNKFALFPLFKAMAYGFTQDLYNQMEKDGVDMVMFDSAVKSGSEGAQKFHPDTFRRSDDESDEQNWDHDEDGNRTKMKPDIRNFKFNVYKQEYKFIRRQLNTDPREDEKMHIGTQMLKITLSNLIMDAMYKTSRGEIYGNQLRDDIMECMNELAVRGETKLRNTFFNKTENGEWVISEEKLSKFLKHELSLRNADQNTLKQLDIVDGHFRTPLEAMSSIAWIESIIISHINKEVIDINLPGNAFYQRTPFGMEGSPIRIVSDEVLDTVEDKSKLQQLLNKAKKQFQIYSGRTLKAINNEGSMDCIISIDYFMNQTDLIPKEYRNNYWAARNWLKKNDIIGKNASAIMVGYRIPTQAESSVHALRVVDVLPIVRDTIVLPKDFTKTTGSDFDIDKLYLTSFNFKRNEDGTATKSFDESDDRYWQNRLLDNYMTLLKDGGYVDADGKYHKGRTLQFLHRSIDNDTSLVKTDDPTDIVAVYNRIFKNRNIEPEQPFGYQSLHSQVDIKTQFVGGKFGIGPFALANNAQILTMLYNVSFRSKPGSIMNELGILSLHDRTDKNGNSILAWLSAMINAHVDVAKDPYITALNVNSFTYGLVNMMLRTGIGDQTFMFTAQPIMVEAASAFDMAGGTLVEDPGKSKTSRQERAVRLQVESRLGNLGKNYKTMLDTILSNGRIGDANYKSMLSAQVAEVSRQLFGIVDGKYTNEFYRWDHSTSDVASTPVKGRTILEDILVNPEIRLDPEKPMSMDNMSDEAYYAIKIGDQWEPFSAKEVQLYVIASMYEFKPYVNALENTVKYTKIDTKKHGSSWSDQQDYKEQFEELYVDENNEENEFFTSELNDMLDHSFIGQKTTLSINLLNDILKDSAIQYTDKFRAVQWMLLDAIKSHTDDSKARVPRIILGYIKQQFFNKYMDDNDIVAKDLFIGNGSIQSRLSRIKYKIKNDTEGEYFEYGSNGVVTNSLLAALESVPYERSQKQPMFVKMKKSMMDDAVAVDDIIRDWNYMLNDTEHEDMQEFARDLVVYAFLTSADTNGFTKFFKLVPAEWKESSGYNDYMTSIKNLDSDTFIDIFGNDFAIGDMILNNWFDNTILPITNFTDRRSNNGKRFSGHSIVTSDPVLKKSNIFDVMAGVWKNNKRGMWTATMSIDDAPMFIKIRRPNSTYNEEAKFLLYQLIGTNKKVVDDEYLEYPIYRLVEPRGVSVSAIGNQFNIYEYGRGIGFEYITDKFTFGIDQESTGANAIAESLAQWIQTQSGKIEKQSHSVRDNQQAEGTYIDLKKEGTEQSEELDPELEEAKKKGKEVKDFCNNN